MTSKCNHRGTAYVLVLASALLVMILGLGSLLAVRVQRRTVELGLDATDARLAAQSALSIGLIHVAQDPNWRSTWSSGTWIANKALGTATFSLKGEDPGDNDLGDSDEDALILTGIGRQGSAMHQAQVTLVPVIEPLEALNMALHVNGTLNINGGKWLTVIDAPLSCNSTFDNDGILDGDAEVGGLDSTGTITGSLTTGIAAKALPESAVFARYQARATVIVMSGNIDKQVLTPTYNPWDSPNADGVYYIDTQDHDITIQNSRIEGTLIIDAGDKKVTLDNSVFMRNARSDYPVLMVKGDMDIKHHGPTEVLSEAAESTNFNPVGAPYEGQTDNDKADVYPNEVQGLIHVTGTLNLSDNGCVRGAILYEGSATCAGANTILHDPALYATPPDGYTYVRRMQISPGSFTRVVP
jgi:hypothetical protein